MIDTISIKNRIHEMAISGQFSIQDNENETAIEYVREISKDLNGVAFETLPNTEVIPFSVPINWCWCRLSDIGSTNIGLTYHPEDVVTDGIPVLRSNNIVNNRMDYSDLLSVNCEVKEKQYLNKGDILICARNGSKALIGKCAIYDGEIGRTAFGAFMAVFRSEFNEYLYLYFQTKAFRRYFENDNNKQINQVTQKILKDAIVPIPPPDEQKRIVESVNNVFKVLDSIDEIQSAYFSDLEILKSKIIDAGIQGKLTEQLPEDGNAEDLYAAIQEEKQKLIKEKKIKKMKALPEITEDEIPFDIPANWKWVRIGELFTLQAGKNIPAGSIKESPDDVNIYPCYGGNGLRGYVSNSNVSGKHAIIGRQGALCGNINFAEADFYATEHAVVVYQYADVNVDWIGITLRALNLNQYATSVAQPGLAVSRIDKVLIPLPPLAEQERIVEKVLAIESMI